MSKAEIEDVTIANLMWLVELNTTKIVVSALANNNNKYALEPMRYAVAQRKNSC